MAAAGASSSSSVDRRRSAEIALLRAIARSHVETLGLGAEVTGLTPDVQEHLADEILGRRLVGDEAEQKPEDAAHCGARTKSAWHACRWRQSIGSERNRMYPVLHSRLLRYRPRP